MRRFMVCVAVAGCSQIETRSAVRGQFVDRFHSAQGVIEQPTDLSTRAFRVYSKGRWYPQSGLVTGTSDGKIYIEAPDGPYLLNVVHLDGSMTWHQREDHEFTDVTVRVGRPGAQPATHVPMQLQIDNLAPWGESDSLLLNCFENGTQHSLIELDTPLAIGDTQVRGTFDWASTYSGPLAWEVASPARYLLDAAEGDTLTVSRVARVLRTGFNMVRLTQIARGPASTQRDGEPSSYAGTFVDVPPTTSLPFTVDIAALTAQLPGVDDWVIALRKSPAAIAFDTSGPSLISVSGVAQGTAPVTFTESYGDPFDDGWHLIASAAFGERLEPPLLSDGRRRVTYQWAAYAVEHRHIAPGAAVALGAAPAFITSATLDDQALTGDVAWNGRSPLSLRFDAPDGHSGIVADVLWVPPDDTFPELWTTVHSESDEVELPAELLQLGVDYLLRVRITHATETSSSSAFRLLGPFRLVAPSTSP